MSYVTLGQGSYGTIIMNKNNPSVVIKIHQLSSNEIDYAKDVTKSVSDQKMKERICSDLFSGEFKIHNELYSNQKHVSVIIPYPVKYEYVTRHTKEYITGDDACSYTMQKLKYPTHLNGVVKRARLKDLEKSNPAVHSPPYLFFSSTSTEYQNGIVQLSDLEDVEQMGRLYYVINNKLVHKLAHSMINCFFQLTYRNEVILQDVEFLLSEKYSARNPTVGIIDFNQVVHFAERVKAVKGRAGPNYSIEFDIANTYLFLSGIDTGFFMTDRNTNWKFMPTPNILPHEFFYAISKEIDNLPKEHIGSFMRTVGHICENIHGMELSRIRESNIQKPDAFNSLYNQIMIWHELLIYGMLSEDETMPIDVVTRMSEREGLFEYEPANKYVVSKMVNTYTYFIGAKDVKINLTSGEGEDFYYFVLKTTTDNNSYVQRFQKSIHNGVMTENVIQENYPHVWFDIAFQRLFLIKHLAANMKSMSNKKIAKLTELLKNEASFKQILRFFHLVNSKTNNMSLRSRSIRKRSESSSTSRRNKTNSR